MRLGFRTLTSLALCAAAVAAALAHSAIDVLGDYALAHDAYDHLAHDSRALVGAFAALVAVLLAARGLRACCEIAQRHRGLVARTALGMRDAVAVTAASVAGSVLLVPGMEWLDGRLDGATVARLADAFGGSLLLGLATTVVCATLVAVAVLLLARWLLAQRDVIAGVVATLLRRSGETGASGRREAATQILFVPRISPSARRLSKRGPPAALPA